MTFGIEHRERFQLPRFPEISPEQRSTLDTLGKYGLELENEFLGDKNITGPRA